MNFNFVFISYTVIYAKYSYCYEVPKEQPQRYFDGKEWKIVKPRPNIRSKVQGHSNISVDLDWAELFKEMKAIEFEETTTQMPIIYNITTTGTTKKATVKKANTVRQTLKKTTKKKFTTKATCAPKIFIRTLSHITLPTTTARTMLPHCRPVCKLKLKSTTLTTIDPQALHLKMSMSGDWRDNWNLQRPTKKLSPVTSKKYTPKVTKICYIPTIKNVHVTTTRNIATKGPLTTTKKPVTPYRGPVTTTWNPVKSIKRPVITTKKPATTIRRPMTTTKAALTKTAKYIKLSGKSADVANPTGNWSNLLKEFLKYVEETKCQRPPCKYETATSTMPFSRYERAGNRKIILEDDDLMNILMDGVEIDDRLNEEGDNASKSKETLEYEGQRINYESVEGSVSQMNNDYRNLGLKSLKDSITKKLDTRQFPKKMEYLKQFHGKNSKKDFTSSHNRKSEINLDEFKLKNKNDDIFDDYEAKSYPGALEINHAKEGYLNSRIRVSEAYLDESKYKNDKKDDEMFQDIETKVNSDALKDKKDYMFSDIKRSGLHLDNSKDNKTLNDDNVLQASDIKSYSDTLKENYVNKDYKKSRIRGSGVYPDERIDKNIREENEIIEDNVLHYFTNALENKHSIKENEPEDLDSYLDGENIRQQDKENYLQDESKETFNSEELNEIKDYAAPNLIYSTQLKSQTNDEDLLQDSDITFDLEDYSVKADKYPENRIEAQKRDSEYAYTFNDLNELN